MISHSQLPVPLERLAWDAHTACMHFTACRSCADRYALADADTSFHVVCQAAIWWSGPGAAAVRPDTTHRGD